MLWRKYHSYFLLSLVVLLSTFCFGVNKVNASDVQLNGSITGDVFTLGTHDILSSPFNAVQGLYKNSMGYPVGFSCNSCTESDPIGYYYNYPSGLSALIINNSLSGAGDYYWVTRISNGTVDNYYYVKFYYDGGTIYVPEVPNTSTHFTSFTYSTTTQTARVQGYWNATTTPNVTERLEFHQFSTMLGTESFKQVVATTTGLFDYTFEYRILPSTTIGTTTANITATTTLFARIYQYDNNYATDPFYGVFDSRYKTLLVSTTTSITATTTDLSLITGRDVFAYPEYECGITSLTGCIKNALIWAFYPTEDSINQYKEFISVLQSKAPVGYFYTATNSLNNLSATSTNNIFDIDIPYSLKRYIFTPFDVAIAGILWFFFLINFYKRFKTIQL